MSHNTVPSHVRDMVGYGGKPPCCQWPDGIKLVISIVLNYEEGGESSVLNGCDQSEQFLCEVVGIAPVKGARCPQVESMYEYGSRAGFWRLYNLLMKKSVPVTVFAVASALRNNPAVAAALRDAQHTYCRWEIATHGDRWIDYRDMPYDDEVRETARAVCTHTELMGVPPVGYYIGRTSTESARICAELGFMYNSDSYADDYPYYTQPLKESKGDERYMLVVPYTLDVNDMKFLGYNGFVDSDQFFRYLKDQVDVLLEECDSYEQTRPLMMSVGLHCRIAGHPARAKGLADFLSYLKKYPRTVWLATRRSIALHWLSAMPPPGPTFHETMTTLDEARKLAKR